MFKFQYIDIKNKYLHLIGGNPKCTELPIVLAFDQGGVLEGDPFYVNEESLTTNLKKMYPDKTPQDIITDSIMMSKSGSGSDYIENWLIDGKLIARAIGDLCEKYNCYVTNHSSNTALEEPEERGTIAVWKKLVDVDKRIKLEKMFVKTVTEAKKDEERKIGENNVSLDSFKVSSEAKDNNIKATIRDMLAEYHGLTECEENIFILDDGPPVIRAAQAAGYTGYLIGGPAITRAFKSDGANSILASLGEIAKHLEAKKYEEKKQNTLC